MHLVIFFCGTGNPMLQFAEQYDYVSEDKVKTLFVKGCDDPQVCNSERFPDLKNYAKRFVGALFGSNGPQLKTTDGDKLKAVGVNFEKTYINKTKDEDDEDREERWFQSTVCPGDENKQIESITLCGYSRGAVTCFEVARELQKIVPNIPVDIVADQPVPGNCYQGPGTNAASIADCSDLTNVKNASVILGAYTGMSTQYDIHLRNKLPSKKQLKDYKNSYISVAPEIQGKSRTLYYVTNQGEAEDISHTINEPIADSTKETTYTINGRLLNEYTSHYNPEPTRENTSQIVHRGFFSQILPKLPRTAKQEHIIIPRESHHAHQANTPQEEGAHMHFKVAEFLYKKEEDLVLEEFLLEKKAEAAATYETQDNFPPAPYPQVKNLQGFFGLNPQEAYRYSDKLHPTPLLRKGMLWKPNESLIEWWNRHENYPSRSTQLTKDLVKQIKATASDDQEQLIKLFTQAEQWLVEKENTATSRYYQVESLRNNIHHHLTSTLNVPKEDLARLNREILHDTGYFLKHWTHSSAAASWFQSPQTDQLDKAFAQHSKQLLSKESDQELLKAMDVWLNLKSYKSKRYDLVLSMYENLKNIIDSDCYPEEGLDSDSTLSI